MLERVFGLKLEYQEQIGKTKLAMYPVGETYLELLEAAAAELEARKRLLIARSGFNCRDRRCNIVTPFFPRSHLEEKCRGGGPFLFEDRPRVCVRHQMTFDRIGHHPGAELVPKAANGIGGRPQGGEVKRVLGIEQFLHERDQLLQLFRRANEPRQHPAFRLLPIPSVIADRPIQRPPSRR